MKTERFTLSVLGCDCDLIEDQIITKQEFNKRIKELKERVKETADNEYPIEFHLIEDESVSLKVEVYAFTLATTDVYLRHYTCKEGYYFK